MRRPVIATLVVLSAVGFAVTCAAWVNSEGRTPGWRVATSPHVTWTAGNGDGHLDLRRTDRLPITTGQGGWAFVAAGPPAGVRVPGLTVQRQVMMRWRFGPGEAAQGIPVPPSRMVFDSTVWRVRVEYWLPAVLLGLPPAAWVDRWRRLRRRAAVRAAGRCGGCGYDLRASPDRCPECGAAAGPADPGTVRNVC